MKQSQPYDEGGILRFFDQPYKSGPSRQYGADVRMLPVEFLRRMIKPSLYGNIKRLEADYIEGICTSMKEHGIIEPLTISLDEQGKICLRDGHHRVVCADLLSIEEAPVRLERSQGVAKHNIPQRDMIDLLWSMLR